MTEQGIDVAWPQGARYNWHQWAGQISFGMCKFTEGLDITDPDAGSNWDSMWWLRPDHRLPRFGYHFFHASMDPVRQAQFFVNTAKQHGLLPGDNLVADFEATDVDGLNDRTPPSVFSPRACTFLEHVNALAPGHRVLPYTNRAFAEAGNCANMGNWYLWAAEYGVSRPAVPEPWHNWTFWQRASTPVDLDVFNGTEEALIAFTRMPDKR